jgi:hypothetical protein
LAAISLVIVAFTVPEETRRSLLNEVIVAGHGMKPVIWQEHQLSQIRSDLLARHPDLQVLSKRSLAYALRDLVHQREKIGYSPGNLEGDLFQLYKDAVVSQTTSYSCQGLNLIFRAMLSAFGIQNRTVMFYAAAEGDPGQQVVSHATADVLLDGAWQAIDATFNFHLESNYGRRLDWLTAYTLLAAGSNVRLVSDDPGRPSGDPLKAAGIDLKRDMKFVAVIGRNIYLRPKGWDGTYRIKHRLHWNVATDSFTADRNLPVIVHRNTSLSLTAQPFKSDTDPEADPARLLSLRNHKTTVDEFANPRAPL